MTKQERKAHAAGKRLAVALLSIENYDGDPNDTLLEAEMHIRMTPNQGASDAVKALREYYEGGE